jgi:TusA-related sulfurtransferase
MSAPRKVQDSPLEFGQAPVAAATINACDLTCGTLEPLIARHLRALAPGEVIEIRSDRDEASDGIRAWVGLTGNTLVTVEVDQASRHARYFVRKKTSET